MHATFSRHLTTLKNASQPMPASMRESLLESAASKVNNLGNTLASWKTKWSLETAADPDLKADHLYNLLEAEVTDWRSKDAEKAKGLAAPHKKPKGDRKGKDKDGKSDKDGKGNLRESPIAEN